MQFHFKTCDLNLPHDFAMASAIGEMIKQEEHVAKWFKKEYLIAKRQFGFKYRNWQIQQSRNYNENELLDHKI